MPYTTRPMRSTEVNGRDYFFTDEAGLSLSLIHILSAAGKRGQAADHDICPPDKEQKHDGRGNCRVFVGADGYPAGAAEEESIFCRRRIRESVF